MKAVIITILIYSLILSVVTLYKDNSSYFIVEPIDVIVAGPVMWFLILFLFMLRPLLHKIQKEKLYKEKDSRYISKIVKKIIKQYKKKRYTDDYFDFSFRQGEFNVNDVEGWGKLLRQVPSNEKLNDKFSALMYHQKEETVNELMKYCTVLTEEKLKKDNCNDYFISIYKNKNLLKVI